MNISKPLIGALALLSLAAPVQALDADAKRQLMKLAPRARLEQACDTETMQHISKEGKPFSADKVIAYTFKDPVFADDSITAPGAVFRSHGEWYHLSYQCSTEPQHLEVQALHYEIGSKIPHSEWKEYYLYN